MKGVYDERLGPLTISSSKILKGLLKDTLPAESENGSIYLAQS